MKNNVSYVVEKSNYVKVNINKINNILPDLKKFEYKHWYNNKTLNLNEKERILLMFICETLNFCFFEKPKFAINYHNRIVKGTEACFCCFLKEIEKNKEFLSIEYLKNLNKEDFYKIIKSDNEIPLKKSRYANFKDTINTIINLNLDNFYNQLFNIKSDLELLNFITTNFTSFQDISNYNGKNIYFYKRAILLVVDLYYVSNTIKNNITTLENLWAGADYSLPRVLRDYGILEYNNNLANIIDNGLELLHDSVEEIEIRANTIYAIKLIKEKLKELNLNYDEVTLDSMIWNLGASYKSKKLYHHTYTTFY